MAVTVHTPPNTSRLGDEGDPRQQRYVQHGFEHVSDGLWQRSFQFIQHGFQRRTLHACLRAHLLRLISPR